jgi:hypothetical protein
MSDLPTAKELLAMDADERYDLLGDIGHPDFEPEATVADQEALYYGLFVHSERTRVEFDPYDGWTFWCPGLYVRASIDDEDYRVKNGHGMVEAVTGNPLYEDPGGETLLLLEGEEANGLVDLLADHFEGERSDALEMMDGPGDHGSLSVGERNPGLSDGRF